MKNQKGEDASIDNRPSQGGTSGLELFDYGFVKERVRGTSAAQGLGTAIVIINESDLPWARHKFEDGVLIWHGNLGDGWELLSPNESDREEYVL